MADEDTYFHGGKRNGGHMADTVVNMFLCANMVLADDETPVGSSFDIRATFLKTPGGIVVQISLDSASPTGPDKELSDKVHAILEDHNAL